VNSGAISYRQEKILQFPPEISCRQEFHFWNSRSWGNTGAPAGHLGNSGLFQGHDARAGKVGKKKRGGKWRCHRFLRAAGIRPLAPDSHFIDHLLPRPDNLEESKPTVD